MLDGFDDLFENLPTPRGLASIRRDLLGRPIATVMDADQASRHYLAFMRGELDDATLDARLEACILERGMTKAEIEREFPPEPFFPGQPMLSFNRTALIATILWQEWQRVGQRRPKGNIRHFWYTHLMYTLTRVMKDTNIASIESCYNRVLGLMVRHEGFRYADLNFVSMKSQLCEAIFADSPYPNIILACEKESYHAYLKRLAHVFHITFISLGGQGSYGVYEDLVFQFIEYSIDVNQEFRLFVVSDFDPHGYKIQAAAKDHLERAGIRQVTLERVYLNPEHITPGIIERFAVPYDVQKSKDTATKSACTLYNWFGAVTGGIYKRAGQFVSFPRNGDGFYHVPALTTGDEGYELYRVELDNFREEVLIELLIDALERVIDGAEYYYAAAKALWRQTIRDRATEAARGLIQRAVWAKTRLANLALREVRDRLDARWQELTGAEHTLIERVRDDADAAVDVIQDQIDGIQAQIEALRARQDTLTNEQWAIRETAEDIIDFLHAVQRTVVPDIPEASQILATVDARLQAYGDAQEEAHLAPVTQQFVTEPADIRAVVDCSPSATTVFERARAGADTFTAELDVGEARRVRSAAEAELEAQQETIAVEVPELARDDAAAMAQAMRDAWARLNQARRRGALPETWRRLREQLTDYFIREQQAEEIWEAWEDGAWRE